jgi:hypothetical protein
MTNDEDDFYAPRLQRHALHAVETHDHLYSAGLRHGVSPHQALYIDRHHHGSGDPSSQLNYEREPLKERKERSGMKTRALFEKRTPHSFGFSLVAGFIYFFSL